VTVPVGRLRTVAVSPPRSPSDKNDRSTLESRRRLGRRR
jgi:hypothetical protein